MEQDILDEFEMLSSVDLHGNYSIGQVIGHLGGTDISWTNKGTTNVVFGMRNNDGELISFAKHLLEGLKMMEARNIAGISEYRALKFTHILLAQCEKLGLPKFYNFRPYVKAGEGVKKEKKGVWRRPNVKLNDLQVAQIKKMLNEGLSTYKVATMYQVSQSAIHLIKCGLTWKEVSPAEDVKHSSKQQPPSCKPLLNVLISSPQSPQGYATSPTATNADRAFAKHRKKIKSIYCQPCERR